MARISQVCTNYSPYSQYNCELTSFPEGFVEKAYENFDRFENIVTFCLQQFKKTFCFFSLASEAKTSVRLDQCILQQRLKKKGALETELLKNQFNWTAQVLGVQKGASMQLSQTYINTDHIDKFNALFRITEGDDLKKIFQMDLAIKEDKLKEAREYADAIVAAEEKLHANMLLLNAYSLKCDIPGIKPFLDFVLKDESISKEMKGNFLLDLISPCTVLEKEDEILNYLHRFTKEGLLEDNQKLNLYKGLAYTLLISFSVAFEDDQKNKEFERLLSFFKKIKDEEGQFIFAKELIDACINSSEKDKAIEVTELISNDENRMETFQIIYRGFSKK